jgi:hypothetical protein
MSYYADLRKARALMDRVETILNGHVNPTRDIDTVVKDFNGILAEDCGEYVDPTELRIERG